MPKIIARCPAKLNLTFDIVGELPGGFHDIATIYQSIDLEDELTFEIEPADQTTIQIKTVGEHNADQFPVDGSNLICRAAFQYMSSLPNNPSIALTVDVAKNIPTASGLAGGSSNAAATLLALNYHFKHLLGQEELLALAEKIGSDVPFFLEGGTCLGRGRGGDLSRLANSHLLHFLIIKPKSISISTPWAYQAYDEFIGEKIRPDLEAAIADLKAGETENAACNFGNAFEPVIFFHYPQLHQLKKIVLDLGACCCHLTGKGPTFYAMVSDCQAAKLLEQKIRERYLSSNRGATAGQLHFVVAKSVPYGARLTGES